MDKGINFKRPSRKIIALAVILVIALSAVFALSRKVKIELPAADNISSVEINRYKNYEPMGTVIVTDKGEINQLLNTLSGAAKTRQKSVNDNPVSDNYLGLNLHTENKMRTLYLYTDGKDYIEEPYVAIYRLKDGFNFAYSMYNEYLIKQNIAVDTISIIVWKEDNRQIHYSLFDGDITPTLSELTEGRMYNDVLELNAALMEYPQDTISLIHVKQTENFTKEEVLAITEQFIVPSDFYSMATGLYEPDATTHHEAQDITADTVQSDNSQ